MRVLVTGGAGYIGSVLVPMLLARDYQVRVLDSLMHGGQGLLPHFHHPFFQFMKGDVRDPAVVRDAVRNCDAVIHLAAIVGFPACRKHPELAQTVNVEGARVLAEASGRERPVLFGSTGSNYGALVDEVCTEDTPLNPVSHYGRTKTEAERILLRKCPTVAFRFATAFGVSPRMRLDLLVNEFVYQAIKMRHLVVYEKHFLRTFLHVRDVARAFLFALENSEAMVGQVYNVGSESMNYSKQQLCEMIRRKVDYYIHYAEVGQDADRRNYYVSYEKIRSLGYHATLTLEQGIHELAAAMEAIDVVNPYANV